MFWLLMYVIHVPVLLTVNIDLIVLCAIGCEGGGHC